METGGSEIRVCRWLGEEEYRRLLKYLDYVGRSYGCSVFKPNMFKLSSNIDNLDELLTLLKLYADNYFEAVKVVETAVKHLRSVTIEVDMESATYIVRSKVRIGGLLAGIDGVKYDVSRRAFMVKPYALLTVINKLASEGFTINDTSGMTLCDELKGYSLRVELRPYQREALNEWLRTGMGVISLPTGSGKTLIALAAIVETGCPTLIVVYTREQLVQWREKVLSYTNIPAKNVGVFYGEVKEVKPITISTYQSVVRHIKTLSPLFKLLVVDEAHHLPARKFKQIALGIMAPYRMGLSATPYREDGLHTELFKLMGGLVYSKNFDELASQGYIASYEVVVVRVTPSIEEKRIYKKLVDELRKYPRLDDILNDPSIDYSQVAQAYKLVSELKKFLTSMESKIKVLKRIVSDELSRGSKIIVFTEYVNLASRISRELNALLLTGKLSESLRDAMLREFRSRRKAVLVTTSVGDEGLDISDANVGILLTSLISRRQFKQRLGRLLRPKEGKIARLYILVAKGTFEDRRVAKKLLEDYVPSVVYVRA